MVGEGGGEMTFLHQGSNLYVHMYAKKFRSGLELATKLSKCQEGGVARCLLRYRDIYDGVR